MPTVKNVPSTEYENFNSESPNITESNLGSVIYETGDFELQSIYSSTYDPTVTFAKYHKFGNICFIESRFIAEIESEEVDWPYTIYGISIKKGRAE